MTEVIADSFQMLESRQNSENNQATETPQPNRTSDATIDPHDPFANSAPMNNNDEDLPF